MSTLVALYVYVSVGDYYDDTYVVVCVFMSLKHRLVILLPRLFDGVRSIRLNKLTPVRMRLTKAHTCSYV